MDQALDSFRDYFADIRFFLEIVAAFTVLQFLALVVLGSIAVWNVHRIAETFERATPKNNASNYNGPYRP